MLADLELLRAGTWEPFALVGMIAQISIFAAAFALLSQIGLETLFSLENFPHSVESISLYGGAVLLQGSFIDIHATQAAVMKWDLLLSFLKKNLILAQGFITGDLPLSKRDSAHTAEYLKGKKWNPNVQTVPLDKNLKDAIQQSREVLRYSGSADPLYNCDLNECQKLTKGQLEHITDVKAVGRHHHGHGFAAILADIIAYSVLLPTFFVA